MPRKREREPSVPGRAAKAARRNGGGLATQAPSSSQSLLGKAATLRDRLAENAFETKTAEARAIVRGGALDMASATSLVQLYGDALQWARRPAPLRSGTRESRREPLL